MRWQDLRETGAETGAATHVKDRRPRLSEPTSERGRRPLLGVALCEVPPRLPWVGGGAPRPTARSSRFRDACGRTVQ